MPLARIMLGVITDTSLPVGDFTNVLSGVFGTGTQGGGSYSGTIDKFTSTVVPVPAAIWLFGTGLAGFFGFARRSTVAR